MIKIPNFIFLSNLLKADSISIAKKYVNTISDAVLEKSRYSKLGAAIKSPSVEEPKKKNFTKPKYIESTRDYKYIYPDFLPNPIYYFRDKIREKLERKDMISRRKQIDLPEFYVGSILSVTVSDPYAPGKINRFVGICIRRDNYGLRHNFTLRNVVDGLGIEIVYDLYNPTLQAIDVLKLEKRLDDNLTYLQDCPAEYSTIPFDFRPVKLPPGVTVPLNTTKVPLNKKPWRHRWDRKSLNGVIYPELKRYEYEQNIRSHADIKPYEKWDMMKHYRESIHDDDLNEIVQEIRTYESEKEIKKEIVVSAKKIVRSRNIPKEKI